MKHQSVSLQALVDGLSAEGLLPEVADKELTRFMHQLQEVQPWYIRTMVGFGAWLASLLLIGFVGSIGLANDSGFIIVGALFVGGAILVRYKSHSDFLVQSALASSLAGQALLAYGIAVVSGSVEIESIFTVLLGLNIMLFLVFPTTFIASFRS